MAVAKAKIGVFGIGLAAYWPQFEGLKEHLEGYQRSAPLREKMRLVGDCAQKVCSPQG